MRNSAPVMCQRINMRVKVENGSPRCPQYVAGVCSAGRGQSKCVLLERTEPVKNSGKGRLFG